jgi:hypothetical protein
MMDTSACCTQDRNAPQVTEQTISTEKKHFFAST